MSYQDLSERGGKTAAPPLWVWYASFALVILVVGGSAFALYRDRVAGINLALLDAFHRPYAGRKIPKVALIGTSLTDAAFYGDTEMERLARENGSPARFAKLWLDGASLFELRKISDRVLSAHPDLVCIEATPFALDRGMRNFVEQTIYAPRDYVINGLHQFLRNMSGTSWLFPASTAPATSADPATIYRLEASRFRVRDFEEGKSWAEFFNAASAQGTTVVLLDLGRSRQAWDILPKGTEGRITMLMKQYERAYPGRYLRFPFHLDRKYFKDLAHLGPTGRRLYSKWFVDRLPGLLGKADK